MNKLIIRTNEKTYVYSRPIIKIHKCGNILNPLLAQQTEKSGEKHVCLTFDGEARTGKTSTARLTARCLNYSFLSTGLLYRAISLYCLQNQVNIAQKENLTQIANNIELKVDYSKSKIEPIIVLNDQHYTEKDLHTEEIDQIVSKVSPYSEIRDVVRKVQWDLMEQTNCVIEGRDIGSYIASKEKSNELHCNTTRFYLKADLEKCAERDVASGVFKTIEEALQSQSQRNNDDKNRKESPLVIPEDSIIIDTSKYKDAIENTDAVLGSLAKTLYNIPQVIQGNSCLILLV